jgi:hypothetical protein
MGAERGPALPGRRRRILIVDDERSIRALLTMVFTRGL